MKHVWKCDFCSHTGIKPDDVKIHEDSCTFNPKNRNCYTCDHRTQGDYPGDGDQCKIHGSKHFWKAEDNEIECDDWSNISVRTDELHTS